jgi:hypothetical protein
VKATQDPAHAQLSRFYLDFNPTVTHQALQGPGAETTQVEGPYGDESVVILEHPIRSLIVIPLPVLALFPGPTF